MPEIFPSVWWQLGSIGITDTVGVAAAISLLLCAGGAVCVRWQRTREVLETIYEFLDGSIREMAATDPGPLVPLVLTQWLFILATNLVGLVPGVASPTRDLSLTAALAVISLGAGHVFALRVRGIGYLRHYLRPHPLLLPFNLIGELSRTAALALRLFGNMFSATLIGSVLVYLVGFLLPVPLMLLSVLTGAVQAYIFGVLTLVFSVSAARVTGEVSGGVSGVEA